MRQTKNAWLHQMHLHLFLLSLKNAVGDLKIHN